MPSGGKGNLLHRVWTNLIAASKDELARFEVTFLADGPNTLVRYSWTGRAYKTVEQVVMFSLPAP